MQQHSFTRTVCVFDSRDFHNITALFSPLKSLIIFFCGGEAMRLQTGRKWILGKKIEINLMFHCGRTVVDSITRNPGFFNRSVHVRFVVGKVAIGQVSMFGFFDFPPISIIPPLLRTHSLIRLQPMLRNRSKWEQSNNTLKSRFVPVFKETLRDGPRFEDRLCLCLNWLCERQPIPSAGTTKDTFDRKFQFPFSISLCDHTRALGLLSALEIWGIKSWT